jgi:hypothetical protein
MRLTWLCCRCSSSRFCTFSSLASASSWAWAASRAAVACKRCGVLAGYSGQSQPAERRAQMGGKVTVVGAGTSEGCTP